VPQGTAGGWRGRFTEDGELVDEAAERLEGLARQGVARLDIDGFLETAHGLAVHFLTEISAAEIVVREMPRFVAARFDGLLQPRDGFIELPEFDQIGADVVVGIAEIRVQFDGALAFRDGIEQFALKVIRPAEEGVRFRCGMQIKRRLVELDRAIVFPVHLRLISVLKDFPRASQRLLIHEAIVDGKVAAGQRY
jgi:hypothetical protein